MIVHAYYQLLVNANDIILTGTLAPQDEFLRVGSNRESSGSVIGGESGPFGQSK